MECPCIENIPFPRKRTPEEMNGVDVAKAQHYVEYARGVIESSMALCKEYYEQLQDALYTVGAYITAYDRAIESNDYSYIQVLNAYDSLGEIEDENKTKINNNLEKYFKNNRDLSEVLLEKRKSLKNLYDNLNTLSARVIEINNDLDNFDFINDVW